MSWRKNMLETASGVSRRMALVVVGVVFALSASACTSTKLVRFPAVYVDMDGTALGTDHQVRAATVRALKRYQSCGGRVGIATGRTLEQVKPFLADLDPSLPVVLFNGALSVSPEDRKILSVQYLTPEAIARVLLAGSGNPDVLGIVVHDVEETVIDRKTEAFDKELATCHILASRVHEGPPAGFTGKAVKVMVITYSGKVDVVAKKLGSVLKEDARAIITSPRTVEVVPPGVNKAVPILKALSDAGIDPKQVLLFGDSGNDVEMLSQVGVGIAMGNCRPEACKAAMFRIGTNGTDAIAEVIERLALTPECPLPPPR